MADGRGVKRVPRLFEHGDVAAQVYQLTLSRALFAPNWTIANLVLLHSGCHHHYHCRNMRHGNRKARMEAEQSVVDNPVKMSKMMHQLQAELDAKAEKKRAKKEAKKAKKEARKVWPSVRSSRGGGPSLTPRA